MASGLPITTWLGALKNTLSAPLDLDLTTHKLALVNSTFFSGLDYNTYNAWTSTNESYGDTGWVTTGYTLATINMGSSAAPVIDKFGGANSAVSNQIKYSMDNILRTGTTIPGSTGSGLIHGCLLYADALTGKPVYCAVDFGADYSTNSGSFGITWAGTGVFTLTLA